MKLEILTMRKPPIDFGIHVGGNFRCWRISLVFVDILLNINFKGNNGIVVGIGIPFLEAIVVAYTNAEKLESK